MLITSLILLSFSAILIRGSSDSCEIPISSKDREHYRLQWPLVFTKNGEELYETNLSRTGAIRITVANGAEVLLSCGPNYFKKFYKIEILPARCNGETGNFTITSKNGINIVEGTEMNIKELTCDLRVIEEVLSPGKGCASEENQLTSSSFGYVDPLEQKALVLGEACYDTVAGITEWAHIKLGQKAESDYLKKLEKSHLTANQHPDGRYKIDLFRGLHFDELYERMRNQLHTTVIPSLKISNYVNDLLLSNLQFQSMKKLGWNYFVSDDDLHVLDTLREDVQALSKKIDLDIFVGGHGVLRLQNEGGEQMDVYLHAAPKDDTQKKITQKPRFPVPSIVWLLIRHEAKATAFAIFNNAAITKQAVAERNLCKTMCDQVSWLVETKKLSDAERTPLVCCSYNELGSAVKGFPKHLEGIKDYLL